MTFAEYRARQHRIRRGISAALIALCLVLMTFAVRRGDAFGPWAVTLAVSIWLGAVNEIANRPE